MSRKGNCWDNAVMERFFLNLKMDRVWQQDYANHAEASRNVTDDIVGFYNTVRLHSTLGYMVALRVRTQRRRKTAYRGVRKNLTTTPVRWPRFDGRPSRRCAQGMPVGCVPALVGSRPVLQRRRLSHWSASSRKRPRRRPPSIPIESHQ
ncbi:transposase [Denitromonas halophila]|uniref:Transposase n=1 Tax=Denitromonas halophila TaxID=1629404 RepID=A0A557QWE1_9RHOO|nr:transposase [Denitromonas halophila]